MHAPLGQRARFSPLCWLALAATVAFAALPASGASNTDGLFPEGPFGHWWLPKNYSKHGQGVDRLFIGIFWTTMVVFVAVQIVLVYFLIKYRRRPDKKKARFTHGNTKLEIAWTVVPAIILLVLSVASKRVWDDFRYAPWADDPNRVQVLVVGEQFKWNVVYPGPDGKLGRYLVYPKLTDEKFRKMRPDAAMSALRADMLGNPLGRDITSGDADALAGKDDDLGTPGRPIILPAYSNLDVHISSKDVLHSFSLPNFRVKLDTVPGMRGHVYFFSERQSTVTAPIDKVPADKRIWLDQTTPKAIAWGNPLTFEIYDPKDIAPDATDPYTVDPNTLTRTELRKRLPVPPRPGRKYPWLRWMVSLQEGADDRLRRRLENEISAKEPGLDMPTLDARVAAEMTPQRKADEVAALRADLKRMGITELSYVDRPFEVVCQELCGSGHYTMNGEVIFVSPQQYKDFLNKAAAAPK